MSTNTIIVRKKFWLAWLLLFVGLYVTVIAVVQEREEVSGEARKEFDFACSQIQLRIEARMHAHEQILLGAAALFDASDKVSHEAWQAFVSRQKVERTLPGIQGIGFSQVIAREQLSRHIQEIRGQGFPDYTVKPEGERDVYTSIIYIEPFSGRNYRLFGYDMFSEPVRRLAMERSRDMDAAVLSGKVTLVQETDQDVQAGTLMYVPVYGKGMPTATVAQRRAALVGWVYSPYRMNDLMRGVLGGWDSEAGKRIRLQIYDGDELSTDSLLYDSMPQGTPALVNAASPLPLLTPITFNDHLWSLRFTQAGNPLGYDSRVFVLFFGGAIISFLVFGLVGSLVNTRSTAQQMAEGLTADLRESEEKFRLIYDNSQDGIFFTVPDGRVIAANPAACEMLRRSEQEICEIGRDHVVDVTDPRLPQALEERSRTGKFVGELNFRRKEGEVFPVELASTLFLLKSGELRACIICRDITERTRSAQLQQESEERLLLALWGADLGMWDWNILTGEVIFNARWAEMLGYSLAEVEPHLRFWEKLAHPDDVSRVMATLKAHLEGETPYYEAEHRLRGKSGQYIWILDKGKVTRRDEQGRPLRAAGIHQDISRRKQVEEKLRKSEERLALAMQASRDAIWDWDLSADDLYYSLRWWEMIGYEVNELETDSSLWRRLMHPEDLERANHVVSKAIAGETSFEIETRLLHKQGHYVPILTRGFILRDTDGKAIRVSGTNTDLTERKRIEEEHRQWERQRQQLEKAESLNRMAGAVAHHFNNLLTAVTGNLEIAMDALSEEEGGFGFLAAARRAAERAAEVSHLMLTYLGQSPTRHELLDLSEICRSRIPVLKGLLGKGVVLEIDLPAPGPAVYGDAGQVQQMLSNLVVNASEAIGDGQGRIHLTVGSVPSADISPEHRFPLDWQPSGDNLACLEIRDTGSGIAAKDIDKLFDPFFSSKFTGRGLGLSVALGILRSHCGGITVAGGPGRDSVFRVFLPLAGE